MDRAMASGNDAVSLGNDSARTTTFSPPRTLRVGVARRPSSVTRPASIQALRLRAGELRERAGKRDVEALPRRVGRQRQRMKVGYNRRLVKSGRNACFVCRIPGHRPSGHRPASPRSRARPSFFRRLARASRSLPSPVQPLPDVVDETTNLNAEQMYKLAHDALVAGKLYAGVKLFEAARGALPLRPFAQQAILELAYANYRAGETRRSRSPRAIVSSARSPTTRMSTTPITSKGWSTSARTRAARLRV
jgi:hypothetical protein